MFKTIFWLLLFVSSVFSANLDHNQSNKQELKWDKSKTAFISKKEARYQKYRKKLEAENKKLEEDGFCSCNNN
jgi:phosphorylcholine metabolism protein LicD